MNIQRNDYINTNLINKISNSVIISNTTINPNNINPQNSTNTNNNIQQSTKPLSFEDVLKQQLNKETEGNSTIQFSKHASVRLQDRSISLSDSQIKRLEGGIEIASQKGIKDSLVILDDISLVVNVKNKFVITAMNNQNQNVYTNIDGAVIV